jgi:glycosyltransferase involved in cell wall biosynthesis
MSPWLLATGDFTTFGGMDRANHALALYLAHHERPVHVVAHRVSPDVAAARGVALHLVPRPLDAHLIGAPLLARAAVRQARALGPTTHLLMNGGNGVIGSPTWIHYLHAAYSPEVAASVRTRLSSSAGRQYYLRREREAVMSAPLVICNSRRTADDVTRCYGLPASRLHVVYYGSDASSFGPVTAEERRAAKAAVGVPDDRRVALFIGALGDRRKGFDLLFDAWRSLAKDPAWDVDLLVAGEGSEVPAWRARAEQAGIAARIRFLGFRKDIASVLAAADVLVHPARYEAYGLGVHEAVCRGVPAIVTDIAGVTERLASSFQDLIVPSPPTPASISRALRTWRADVEGWRARANAAGAILRRRTWDDMSAEIVTAVEERAPHAA